MTVGKKAVFILVAILILLFIGVNWQYSFSVFSLKKSISYDADNIVVRQYEQDLNAFKEFYEVQSEENDVTTNWTQYILELYEMPLLVEKGPIIIKYKDLDTMLFEVKAVRSTIIDLAFREDYDAETREYLRVVLLSCIGIEESIERLKDSTFHSKKTLKRQFHNLRVELMSNFDHFSTFYRQYKDAR